MVQARTFPGVFSQQWAIRHLSRKIHCTSLTYPGQPFSLRKLPFFFFLGGGGRTVGGWPRTILLSETQENVRAWWRNLWQHLWLKVARNEVKNSSFAQRSAHRDSRIWRPELIEPAAERNRRARGRRPTFKSAYPDPQILPQCNISSNYPL